MREMRSQLKKMGLSGTEPNLFWYAAVKPTDAAGFPTVGARGCFLSHLAVLQMARQARARSVLILEDDLNFFDDAPQHLKSVAQYLEDHDWGMFHGVYRADAKVTLQQSVCHQASFDLPVSTTAMVAINGSRLGALVEYLEAMLRRPPGDPLGGPMHIDGAYCWFRMAHPDMPAYLVSRPLGYQRSSRTDVHALKWWDRTPFVAAMINTLRRLRNLFR